MTALRGLAVTVVLTVALMAALARMPLRATFESDVRTQFAEVATWPSPSAPNISWDLTAAQVSPPLDYGHAESETRAFVPAPGATITFRRSAGGPIAIECRAGSSGSVGTIERDGLPTKLGARISFFYATTADATPRRTALVFPLVGRARLGSEVPFAPAAPSILTKATVRVLAESLFSRAIVDAGSVYVAAGDAITLGTDERPAYGFVMPEGDELRAHFRVSDHAIVVTRTMSERTTQISAATVIARDEAAQAAWGALVLVTLVVGLVADMWVIGREKQ